MFSDADDGITIKWWWWWWWCWWWRTCVSSPEERAPSAGVAAVDQGVASQQQVNHRSVPLSDDEECHHHHRHNHYRHHRYHCHHENENWSSICIWILSLWSPSSTPWQSSRSQIPWSVMKRTAALSVGSLTVQKYKRRLLCSKVWSVWPKTIKIKMVRIQKNENKPLYQPSRRVKPRPCSPD